MSVISLELKTLKLRLLLRNKYSLQVQNYTMIQIIILWMNDIANFLLHSLLM